MGAREAYFALDKPMHTTLRNLSEESCDRYIVLERFLKGYGCFKRNVKIDDIDRMETNMYNILKELEPCHFSGRPLELAHDPFLAKQNV